MFVCWLVGWLIGWLIGLLACFFSWSNQEKKQRSRGASSTSSKVAEVPQAMFSATLPRKKCGSSKWELWRAAGQRQHGTNHSTWDPTYVNFLIFFEWPAAVSKLNKRSTWSTLVLWCYKPRQKRRKKNFKRRQRRRSCPTMPSCPRNQQGSKSVRFTPSTRTYHGQPKEKNMGPNDRLIWMFSIRNVLLRFWNLIPNILGNLVTWVLRFLTKWLPSCSTQPGFFSPAQCMPCCPGHVAP